MNQGDKYQPYTAEDILRYLGGEMSSAEMRRLELAALDDSFLQDAIDGYRLEFEKAGKEKMLPYLNEAIAQKASGKKRQARVVPFFRMGVFKWAVAAFLVLGTGLLWLNLNKPADEPAPENNALVIQQNEKIDSSTTSAADVAIIDVPTKPSNDLDRHHQKISLTDQKSTTASAPKVELQQNTIASANKSQHSNDDSSTIAKTLTGRVPGISVNPVIAARNERQKLKNAEDNLNKTNRYSSSDSGIIASNAKPALQKAPVLKETISGKMAGVTTNQSFKLADQEFAKKGVPYANGPDMYGDVKPLQLTGKTVDKEKFPLDHVAIAVKGDTIKTVSDEMGRFSLRLPDSVATLVASGVGYETKEFKVNANSGKVELELTPSKASLSEVVVMGYASKKEKRNNEIVLDLDTSEAAPAGGWRNFERYITENRKVKTGKQKTAIVLSIEIGKDGKVGDIDIIESGGTVLDNEAIRLLKECPKWIIKTKEKLAFAKVTIVL